MLGNDEICEYVELNLFSFFGVDRELNAGAAVSLLFTPLLCIYLSAQNDLFKKPFSGLNHPLTQKPMIH